MRVAKVPVKIVIDIKGVQSTIKWPWGAVFFFPEGKKEFNIWELKEIMKEMEKMEKMEKMDAIQPE